MKSSRLSIKQRHKVIFLLLIVLILFGCAVGAAVNVLAGSGMLSDKEVQTEKNQTRKNQEKSRTDTAAKSDDSNTKTDEETAIEDDKTASEEAASISGQSMDDGMYTLYVVGKDISAGVYRLTSDGTNGVSYYKVTDGKSTRNIDLVQDKLFTNTSYVQVKDGDCLYVVDADLESIDGEQPATGSAVYPEGSYKVGLDIPAGEYTVTPQGKYGSVEISSSAVGNEPTLKKYIQSPETLQLNDGEYVSISFCNMSANSVNPQNTAAVN